MQKLFQIVLKTIENSNGSKIFWKHSETYGWYLSDSPNYPVKSLMSSLYHNGDYSETDFYLHFKLKYPDSGPDIIVNFQGFESTELIERTTGLFNNKKISVITKPHPIYTITAGEFSYKTTVIEAKQLHKAYLNLKKLNKSKEKDILDKRLKDLTTINEN